MEDVDDKMQLGTSGTVGSLPSVEEGVAFPSAERLEANSVWANSVVVTHGSFHDPVTENARHS